MKVDEQGAAPGRYQVIPRTLIFLTRRGARGEREVLLIKGAPTKRLWANQYNGLGGHVEAGEGVLAAARRELFEEAGIEDAPLTLRGVVSIDTRTHVEAASPGILIFVFTGEAGDGAVKATAEGAPEWLPVEALGAHRLVEDVPELLARAMAGGPLFFGHYAPQADGSLRMTFV